MATSFKTRLSKNKSQSTITIFRDDNVDLSAVTSIIAKAYTSDVATPTQTFTFTAQNVTDFIAGQVDISTLNLLGSATPADEFYSVILEGNSAAYVSEAAGVGITKTMIYQAMKNSNYIDVYSPDYITDRVFVNAFMLVWSADHLEEQDSSLQKREDFITRQDSLKKALNYE